MEVEDVLEKGFIAHANVKHKLIKIIKGELEGSPLSVKADNKCIVGEWIYGPGVSCRDMAEYSELKTVHADFHLEAYNALILHQQGKVDEALDYVNKGPFEQKSREIKLALTNMKKVAK